MVIHIRSMVLVDIDIIMRVFMKKPHNILITCIYNLNSYPN